MNEIFYLFFIFFLSLRKIDLTRNHQQDFDFLFGHFLTTKNLTLPNHVDDYYYHLYYRLCRNCF